MTVPRILQRTFAIISPKLLSILATDGGINDGNAVEATGTSQGYVNVAIKSGTVAATVTNDGTFAKETGGNLDAIEGHAATIDTSTAATASRFPAVAALADGATPASLTRIGAVLQASNGTTWDIIRASITAAGTPTGWQNVLAGLVYLSSPPTLSNGQGSPLQGDTLARLIVTLGTLINGEDSSGVGTATVGVMAVARQASFTNIATATTTTVKSGAGLLEGICCNSLTATGTITVYDSLTASGTKIGTVAIPVPGATYMQGIKFSTGLTVVTGTAASDLTVAYR